MIKKGKEQITKLLKFGVFLFGFSLLLWNCEKEENVIEATNHENKRTSITPKLAIEEIKSVYNSSRYEGKKSSKEDQQILNEINTKTLAKKSVTTDGDKIYSFVLNASTQNKTQSSSIYFDNLFVNINKENKIEYHLMRYIPAKEWLESNGKIAEYSGIVQYLSNTRKVITSITLEKGIEKTAEQRRKAQAKCGFKLVYKMTVCGALDGDAMSCTHFYELVNDCDGSGGSTSGGDFSSEPDFSDNDGGTTDWGYNDDDGYTSGGDTSSGSGGSSFGGEPILDRCPEGLTLDPKTGLCFTEEEVVPPSCKSFNYKQIGATNVQAAGVEGITFRIKYKDPYGRWHNIDILFSQPIYFTTPRFSDVNGGNLTNGRGAELSADAIQQAHRRAVAYFLATNSTESQVRAKIWEYLKDEMRNGEVIGGSASFTPPLGFIGVITKYRTTAWFNDDCD